jgi:class I fructose-bisphosphate aldolase
MLSRRVRKILSGYESEGAGVKQKLAYLLGHGRLGGSGKLLILPVDQGFEHGPARSFSANERFYDPHELFRLAVRGRVSGFAAPLGLLSSGAESFAGEVPLILKLNSSNSWSVEKDQALTGSVEDALRLGCVGIGLTVYPGSDHYVEMLEEARDLISEARSCGLASVVWSYPRGGNLDKAGETALDVTAYAAHMACLLGAHIVKVKPPSAHIAQTEALKMYEGIGKTSLRERIAHVVQSCFQGRRLVVFSGGAAKGEKELLDEIREIALGGGSGSIVGRNAFQREEGEALRLFKEIEGIYRSSCL